MIMYCTSNSTNEIDHLDEEPLPIKKKKKSMSFSLSQNSLHGESASSSSEKKQRKFCPIESKPIKIYFSSNNIEKYGNEKEKMCTKNLS